MSGPESQKPDDGLLEQFLGGKGAVRAAYRATALEQAPAELDAAILQAAEMAARVPAAKPTQGRRARWSAPMATAAVLVLCFGVFLQVLRDPVAQRQVAASPADIAVPAVASSVVASAPAVAAAQVEAAVAVMATPPPPPSEKRKAERRVAEPPTSAVLAPPVAAAMADAIPAPVVRAAPAAAASLPPELRRARDEAMASITMAQSEPAVSVSAETAPSVKAMSKGFAAAPVQWPQHNMSTGGAMSAAPKPIVDEAAQPAVCSDVLATLGHKPTSLEYLGCEIAANAQVPVLVARYRLAGADAATIETSLVTDTKMSSLHYRPRGWEAAESGYYVNSADAEHPYAVSMRSGDTTVDQREHWQRIRYFYVTVTLPIQSR